MMVPGASRRTRQSSQNARIPLRWKLAARADLPVPASPRNAHAPKVAKRRQFGYLDVRCYREAIGMVGEPSNWIRLADPGTRFRRLGTQAPNSSFRSALTCALQPAPGPLRP